MINLMCNWEINEFGGSEDFGVSQTCRRVASIWDVHLWRVRGCSCSPACLIRSLALVSHLIQTICCGSLHLCRIATTVMSFCCTLHVYTVMPRYNAPRYNADRL